ncbi:MAG: hypothetical protein JKY65_20865 [Planctomycetes bacterium]|nr:hypothetical protein [Planctomycetota bacterium]
MSRADKTLTKQIYQVTLDETNTKVMTLVVTTLCAQKVGGGPVNRARAFSSSPHTAFVATYRFSDRNTGSRFRVPAAAGKLLK